VANFNVWSEKYHRLLRSVRMRRLQFFGYLARRSYEKDHQGVVVAAVSNPPAECKRPRGRPRDTWLRIVSREVQPFSTGVHSAWRLAADRRQWRQVIDTAMLPYRKEFAIKEKEEFSKWCNHFALLATVSSVCNSTVPFIFVFVCQFLSANLWLYRIVLYCRYHVILCLIGEANIQNFQSLTFTKLQLLGSVYQNHY